MAVPKQFVIACGGTGGHLFPGLAVAEELHQRGHEVLLLVSEKEIDAVALREHPQFRREKLPSIGMPAVLSPAFPRFLKRSWDSFSTCRQLYSRYRPVAVLGMGGFTSAAPLLAARTAGIPCFLHESNAIAGRANRLASRWADRVLLGIQRCEASFPGRACTVTGTPVRRDLGAPLPKGKARAAFGLDPDRDPDPPFGFAVQSHAGRDLDRLSRSDRLESEFLVGNGDAGFSRGAPVIPEGNPEIDLAVASDASTIFAGDIHVLLAKGDGTFQAPVQYVTKQVLRTLTTRDLDGDGKVDLVTATSGGGVTVLRGKGDGTFEMKSEFPGPSDPRDIVVADLDGDGK
ncbi:MAG: hypothetical protein EBR40_11150, partial [Proteobacteria bacterium]|nr:hypothetical protein [Pseudomonadota bacterium]